MRILFAGSPAIAVPSLEALRGIEGIELAGALTNPDSPKGRHGRLEPTEVGEAVMRMGGEITVFKPEKLDSAVREQIALLKPDLLVSFAYGRIFGPKFLALFPLGGINVHPSLLPKYRGASPVQAAILNRDAVTGISIQTLALEMDQGDILAQERIQLTGKETAGSLSEIAAIKAARMLPEVLKKIADGSAQRTAQNHDEASCCPMFSKEDGIIDWKQSAPEIDAKIRAFTPWPLCRTIHNGRELIILKASSHGDRVNSVPLHGVDSVPVCGMVLGIDKKDGILIQTGGGILAVSELQYQAKKALFWRDFLNGARDFSAGSQLG